MNIISGENKCKNNIDSNSILNYFKTSSNTKDDNDDIIIMIVI